jgi:hypothetical protein
MRWDGAALQLPYLVPGTFDAYLHVEGEMPRSLGRVELAAGAPRTLALGDVARCGIAGALLDGEDRPIAGGRVIAMLFGLWNRALVDITTDAAGRFRFDDLAPGRWWIQAGDADPEEPLVVDVPPNEEVEVVLRAAQPGSVRGTVTRGAAPVAGQTVYLSPGARRVVTDGEGRFELADVFPGRHAVAARHENGAGEQQRVEEAFTLAAGGEAEVALDLAPHRRTVVVRRHGRPFLELEKALVIGTHRTTTGSRVPGRDDAVALPLEPGPSLLLFASHVAPRVNDSAYIDRFHAVYLAAPSGAEELEVDIDGATLVVDGTGSGEPLPLAYLEGVGAIERPRWQGSPPLLIHDDAEPGRRRVPDLPPGSRVRLGERADAPVVTLDRPGETVVRWPPR